MTNAPNYGDGLDEARSALRVACPQAPAAAIEKVLRDLKNVNRRHGGA